MTGASLEAAAAETRHERGRAQLLSAGAGAQQWAEKAAAGATALQTAE